MMLLTLILIIIISFPFVVVLTINQSYNKIGKSFSTGKAILENSLSSKISIHFIIDRLSKIFTKKRTFAEGVQTVDFMEHIHSVKLDIPEWKGDGLYEVTAQTKEGTMHPAFLVYHWHADSADTIIFNHGAFEYPFDRTFRHLFKKKQLEKLTSQSNHCQNAISPAERGIEKRYRHVIKIHGYHGSKHAIDRRNFENGKKQGGEES